MIEIKNLSKTFRTADGAVEALKDVSLAIPDGDIFGIIGMSGAGKSTLVRTINMLERPTSGSVVIGGVDMGALSGQTVSVAATPTPHAEILNDVVKGILAARGITLDVKEFTDYVQPNNVVDSGEVDANYFQHLPYLEDFNAENGTKVVSIGAIHVEPMGLYGGKQASLDALK